MVIDADAEGVELWQEELSDASGPLIRRQGALEGNGLVALLASVALLLACAIILFPKFKHLTQGEFTVGLVVGHQSYGYGSGSLRAPIIRYTAPGGVFSKLADIPAATSTYPIDKEVWILYLRDDPDNAVVADFVQLFLIPAVVGGLGLFCLSCTSTYMLWQVRPELFTKRPVATRRQTAAPATGDQKEPKDASGQDRSQDANSQNDSQNAEVQNHSPDADGPNDCLKANSRNDAQTDSQDADGQNHSSDADGQDDFEAASAGNREVRPRSHWG